jgi:hypothetical protein
MLASRLARPHGGLTLAPVGAAHQSTCTIGDRRTGMSTSAEPPGSDCTCTKPSGHAAGSFGSEVATMAALYPGTR